MRVDFIRQILTPLFGVEQLRTEQALRAREERFGKIFHVSPVAISVTSFKDVTLLEANDAYWKLTGFDPKTFIGRTTWHGHKAEKKSGRISKIHLTNVKRSFKPLWI